MRKAIGQLFSGNVVSKALGLVREIMTAALFGTSSPIAAYRVALTGTLIPVNFLSGDSLNAAFIPLYIRFKREAPGMEQVLLWMMLVMFGIVAVGVVLFLWGVAGLWVHVLAPGFDTAVSVQAMQLIKIMAIGVPFYLLGTLISYLEMANGGYTLAATRPSMQNIGLIIGVVVAFLLHDVSYLAWGFTSSYIVFFFWATVRTIRAGTLSRPRPWVWPLVRQVAAAFWVTIRPLLLLPVMLQGNIAVERAVASLIGLAAVSAIDYARFISETLILFISVPVALAGLSTWSGLEKEAMRERLQSVIPLMLLIGVPSSAFLAVNAHLVVDAVYTRGAFGTEATRVTGDILFGIALGLWAQVIGYVLIKALNTQFRNSIVVGCMAMALTANVAFNLIFYRLLGPLALGLGNSANGAVLLFSTLAALGLVYKTLPYLAWLAIGVVGYVLLSRLFSFGFDTWGSLAIAAVIAGCYWAVWIGSVASLRRVVLSIWVR